MFSVSKLADYATVVMAYLALHFKELYNARDIADATHIPLPTVSKILKLMLKANLLLSTRGAKGGYSLAREPKTINIAEVLQAIDGDFAMTTCSHAAGECHIKAFCSISCNWQLISQTIFTALQTLTLEDMAKPLQRQHMPAMHEIMLSAIKRQNHAHTPIAMQTRSLK